VDVEVVSGLLVGDVVMVVGFLKLAQLLMRTFLQIDGGQSLLRPSSLAILAGNGVTGLPIAQGLRTVFLPSTILKSTTRVGNLRSLLVSFDKTLASITTTPKNAGDLLMDTGATNHVTLEMVATH
jgi:hypothetical protein